MACFSLLLMMRALLMTSSRRIAFEGATIAYASAGQTIAPLYLKWALVFEDPNTRCVWVGKALPREWLEVGESVTAVKMSQVPTRYGRVGMEMKASLSLPVPVPAHGTASASHANTAGRAAMSAGAAAAVYVVHASLSLPASGFTPPGGVKLRVRAPLHAGKIASVTIGGEGEAWTHFDPAAETVNFDVGVLTPSMLVKLKTITVTFKR